VVLTVPVPHQCAAPLVDEQVAADWPTHRLLPPRLVGAVTVSRLSDPVPNAARDGLSQRRPDPDVDTRYKEDG
jgi:hypothetical protein